MPEGSKMDAVRIQEYLRSLEPEGDRLLSDIRAYAGEKGIPVVRPATGGLLQLLARLTQPAEMLELGTAIAYSSLLLASSCGGKLLTVEHDERLIPLARQNVREAGLEERITLVQGEAGEVLKRLAAEGRQFGLIFLDAAKGQYLFWLEDLITLLAPGGLLVTDNVLQEGRVAESRYTVERRERSTHSRMREFLYRIKHDERLETTVLPLEDGVSLSVKKK